MVKKSDTLDNSFGIASVTLGILSVILSPTVLIGLILGIISLVFGLIQRKRSKNSWSLWGVILSIIGILFSLVFLFMLFSLLASFKDNINSCLANPKLPGCENIAKMYGTP